LTDTALTKLESTKLDELKLIIKEGMAAFYTIGEALKEIRDGRLYKEIFGTFEDYCQLRWGMERRHAYRLIESFDVKENLCPMGHILPANERQVRPLTSLEPEQQQEAWQRVLDTAPTTDEGDRLITAKIVEQAVSEVLSVEEEEPVSYDEDSPSPYYDEEEGEESEDDYEPVVIEESIPDRAEKKFKETGVALANLKRSLRELSKENIGVFINTSLTGRVVRELKDALKNAIPSHECPKCQTAGCMMCKELGYITESRFKESLPADDEMETNQEAGQLLVAVN
jgi:hypothetical protein